MLIHTRITRDTIRAALACAATADIRHYLNGVLIELHAGCAYAVGTTGFILGAVRDDTSETQLPVPGQPITFIMPRELAAMVKPHRYVQTVVVSFDTEAGLISIDDCGQVSASKAIDGVFPDWRRVIPTGKASGQASQFNADYLHTFSKVAKIFGRTFPGGCVYVEHNALPDKPHGNSARVRIVGAPQFVGVIMPIVDSDGLPSIDVRAFCKAPEPEPAAAEPEPLAA